MSRYKLTIEYDGTRYNGWQVQKGERTIQGSFFDACKKVFNNQPFEFYGAGRTDGGVHAFGQVAHLEVKTSLNPAQIRMGINDNLPFDINVLHVGVADGEFHARHDAASRSYVYLISLRRTAFGKNNVWWIKDKLDLKKMETAAQILTGFKDFQSFTDKDAETTSTKVEVNWVDIHKTDSLIAIHITGSHFLWKMVRRMTGILVEVGRGKMSLDEVEQLFKGYSNTPARLTAPSGGLYLEKVYYGNETPARGIQVVPQLLTLK